jgi:outer membrane protein assembly factor BamA
MTDLRMLLILAACLIFCGSAFAGDATAAKSPIGIDTTQTPNDTSTAQSLVDTVIAQSFIDTTGIRPSINDTGIQPSNNIDITQPPIDTTNAQLSADAAAAQPPYDTSIVQSTVDKAVIPPSPPTVLTTDSAIYIAGIEIYGSDTASPETAERFRGFGIKINGRIATRPETFALFLSFKIGDTLDIGKLDETRARLLRTQLYRDVKIFHHIREDGAHIFIVLEEAVRLGLGYGMTYSTRKYGRDDFWYYPNINATLYNFRGRMEEFWIGASVWTHRSLDLSWTKPFLSTPYYISAGAGVAAYPDEALPIDYLDVYAKMTAGRNLTANTRASVSAIPVYRHKYIVESARDSARADVDSLLPGGFYELFGAVSLISDFRPARFDPQSGWYMSNEIRTNRLYNGINAPFFQFRNETRLYLPLLFDDMAALRFALTLRDTDAGEYHRLSYGSAGSIRGYYEKALGWQFVANSSLLASLKYHKPVLESSAFPLPAVNAVFRGVKEVSYRFDATLIADFALLYEEPLGVLTFSGARQYGLGLGFGTRLLIPEIRQSGCIDLVFGKMDLIGDGRTGWKPTLHIYLDLFF